MSEEQLELLQKAITLYSFTISQRDNDDEALEFLNMVEELSKLIGQKIYCV